MSSNKKKYYNYANSVVCFVNTDPLHIDLSSEYCYLSFEQHESVFFFSASYCKLSIILSLPVVEIMGFHCISMCTENMVIDI